jgi:hypothetical protein
MGGSLQNKGVQLSNARNYTPGCLYVFNLFTVSDRIHRTNRMDGIKGKTRDLFYQPCLLNLDNPVNLGLALFLLSVMGA